MGKCYVISNGDHTEYEVHRVFSTEEKALEWLGVAAKCDYGYCIDEHQFDDMSDPPSVIVQGSIDINTRNIRTSSFVKSLTWLGIFGHDLRIEIGKLYGLFYKNETQEEISKVLNEKLSQIIEIYGEISYHGVRFNRDTLAQVDYSKDKKWQEQE